MQIEGLTSTVKHELLHALGFSSSLFAYFRDEDGEPRRVLELFFKKIKPILDGK